MINVKALKSLANTYIRIGLVDDSGKEFILKIYSATNQTDKKLADAFLYQLHNFLSIPVIEIDETIEINRVKL